MVYLKLSSIQTNNSKDKDNIIDLTSVCGSVTNIE